MANVSQSLQDYLSASRPPETNTANGNNTNSKMSWFWKSQSSGDESALSDDPSNGWFSQAQKDPCLPTLSKKQRVIGFIGCLLMGTFCFSLASLYIPLLVLKARKFALLYSLGSLFIIFSFSLLWGPMNHIKGLVRSERLPFTTVYFGTMFATLYFSLWVKSTVLTVVFAVAQIIALVWYVVSYMPGGQTGLQFFSKIFYSAVSKTASKTLPV